MKNLLKLSLIVGVAVIGTMAFSQGCCGGGPKPADKTETAKVDKGVQKVTVVIDGGYSPNTIVAKVGKPLKLTFYRKEKSGCGDEVVFKSLGKTLKVASGKKVTYQFTPKKAGTINFSCGMDMYKGKIVVK